MKKLISISIALISLNFSIQSSSNYSKPIFNNDTSVYKFTGAVFSEKIPGTIEHDLIFRSARALALERSTPVYQQLPDGTIIRLHSLRFQDQHGNNIDQKLTFYPPDLSVKAWPFILDPTIRLN